MYSQWDDHEIINDFGSKWPYWNLFSIDREGYLYSMGCVATRLIRETMGCRYSEGRPNVWLYQAKKGRQRSYESVNAKR